MRVFGVLTLLCLSVSVPAAAQVEPLAVRPLEVPGFRVAAVVPAPGTEPRPLVIGLHGNFDRLEWMCGFWGVVVRGRAFVLCPRGEPRTDAPGLDRWQLPPAGRLRREIAAARAALVARYPGRVADGPDVYVGFSQGANRVSRMAAARPEEFPRIQLVEGGRTFWRDPRSWARRGVRVAFVCAMGWCEQRSRSAARRIERSGHARARLERRPGQHHELDVMAPAIRETFDWIVEGDPRF